MYGWDAKVVEKNGVKVAFFATGFNPGDDGFAILDVTNPSSPEVLATLSTGGYTSTDIQFVGNTVYLVDHEHGVVSIDVSNYSSPIILGKMPVPDFEAFGSIEIVDNFAFVGYMQKGLVVYDISDHSDIQVVHELYENDRIRNIVVDEERNYAYMIDFYNGLKVLNIKDLTNIDLITSFSDESPRYDSVFLQDNMIYLASGKGLTILKFKDENGFLGNPFLGLGILGLMVLSILRIKKRKI
jgi:hypothetical protein